MLGWPSSSCVTNPDWCTTYTRSTSQGRTRSQRFPGQHRCKSTRRGVGVCQILQVHTQKQRPNTSSYVYRTRDSRKKGGGGRVIAYIIARHQRQYCAWSKRREQGELQIWTKQMKFICLPPCLSVCLYIFQFTHNVCYAIISAVFTDGKLISIIHTHTAVEQS